MKTYLICGLFVLMANVILSCIFIISDVEHYRDIIGDKYGIIGMFIGAITSVILWPFVVIWNLYLMIKRA